MAQLDEYTDGGYDVVSWRPNPASLSLLCAAFPFVLGVLLDELPFAGPGWIRRHLGEIVLAALGATLLGTIFGARALRQPKTRALGRIGVAANLVILILLGLFVLAFRWILGR